MKIAGLTLLKKKGELKKRSLLFRVSYSGDLIFSNFDLVY